MENQIDGPKIKLNPSPKIGESSDTRLAEWRLRGWRPEDNPILNLTMDRKRFKVFGIRLDPITEENLWIVLGDFEILGSL